jgi:hypothetical protein
LTPRVTIVAMSALQHEMLRLRQRDGKADGGKAAAHGRASVQYCGSLK